jgi:hypothetical protein
MKRILLLVTVAACPLGAQSSVPTWTLSARPTLDIGSEANTQTQFNGVTGVVRMPGGEIVVANGTSQELRVFSVAGSYLRTLTSNSRTGVLRSLDRIWRGKGDTIYAAEILPASSSVWVFTLNGVVSSTQVGASNAGGVFPVDRFPDGHFVVSAASRRRIQPPMGLTYVDSMPLGVMTMRDLTPKWIGSLRNEMLMIPTASRGRAGGGRLPIAYPFGRSTSVAVSGDRLWLGDSETGTITVHDATGRGLAVFSAPTAARRLDTTIIRRIRTSGVNDAMNWNDRARIDASYSLPFPRNAPRFARFLPGVNGEMWIELFREDPSAPRSYVIVDRQGKPIGRATMPIRMIPLEVGLADLIGVLTDAEGLEHVVRYSLRRSPQ